MNVRFGAIHLLPQMNRQKNRSEQLEEAKAQNRWNGEIFSLSKAAIDAFEEGENTGDFEKASRKASGAEKRLADKPHRRVHVVLTDDMDGQHLTMYRFLKTLDIKPPFIWKQFIAPILQGGFPTEEIHKLLNKMDTSEHFHIVDFLKQVEERRKKERASGKEPGKEEVTPEENDLSSRPVMTRTKSISHRLGEPGTAIKPEGLAEQLEKSLKFVAFANASPPDKVDSDTVEQDTKPQLTRTKSHLSNLHRASTVTLGTKSIGGKEEDGLASSKISISKASSIRTKYSGDTLFTMED